MIKVTSNGYREAILKQACLLVMFSYQGPSDAWCTKRSDEISIQITEFWVWMRIECKLGETHMQMDEKKLI